MNDAIVDVRPRLIVLFGRGRTGKTTFARLLVDRAHEAGRMDFAIADADRTNAMMATFYGNVVQPVESDDQAVLEFLDDLINAQVEDRTTVLLDTRGADTSFPTFAQSLDLVASLGEHGIVPVAVHLIGPDPDDLAVLREIEASKAYCPAQTILVLNAAPLRAFDRVQKEAAYKAAIKRGAVMVHIPKLLCMDQITESRWTFTQAAANLKFTDKHRLFQWRKTVDEALAPVLEFLP